jgi:hypothetical protein
VAYLDDVKTLLGPTIAATEDLDDQLNLIINMITQRLLIRIGSPVNDESPTVPGELGWVVVEASVRRFNRLANEGMSSATVEGESLTFEDAGDDLAPFEEDIQAYLDGLDDPTITRGRVRFL